MPYGLKEILVPGVSDTRSAKYLASAPLRVRDLAKSRMHVIFSARCNTYISRSCYDVSVRLSVRLSVTEVHWRIIPNLGFKFRSIFTAHCGRGACGREGRDRRREEWRDHLALC